MGTVYQTVGLSSPVTFLNATVLSFNGNLGIGGEESSLTVELVEDCETTPPQFFGNTLAEREALIGKPVIFPDSSGGMAFAFSGIVTNWNTNDSSSGKTYTVTLTDPRRLLDNVSVIVDTYSGSIADAPNMYNVYGSYEPQASVSSGNCGLFGSSGVIKDRGMPYSKIVSKLSSWPGGLIIYTPTGYSLTVNLSALPSSLPEYYRANGPAISLLQIITDVCEATGNDFYVYLEAGVVKVGLIDLKQNPTSFNWIQNYGGDAVTERSFGRELRVEKQKTLIFGEKIHYLNMAKELVPFFGENESCEAVTAIEGGSCGFKVLVNTAPLAASLRNPGVFAGAGDLFVSEVDLRCNYDLWEERIMRGPTENLSEFDKKAKAWFEANGVPAKPADGFNAAERGIKPESANSAVGDLFANNVNASSAKLTEERVNEDKKKIFGYLESLKETYYGKQFLAKLNERICYKASKDIIASNGGSSGSCITSEMFYSSEPTNDGGWVETGGSVMGVQDPYLGFFRQEDGRVGAFGLFSVSGDTPPTDGTGEDPEGDGGGGSGGGGGGGSGYVPGGG